MMTDEESRRAVMSRQDALMVLRKWRGDNPFEARGWDTLMFSRREALHRAIVDMAEVERLRERVAALEAERAAASANVQRLLERDAAMRAIVERVATEIDDVTDWFCKRCISGCEKTATGLRMVHEPECLVIQARALLATLEGEGED